MNPSLPDSQLSRRCESKHVDPFKDPGVRNFLFICLGSTIYGVLITWHSSVCNYRVLHEKSIELLFDLSFNLSWDLVLKIVLLIIGNSFVRPVASPLFLFSFHNCRVILVSFSSVLSPTLPVAKQMNWIA